MSEVAVIEMYLAFLHR